MQLDLRAVFYKVPEGYIAFAEELPGANTQGATFEEARANLEEAVLLVLEANRTLAEEGPPPAATSPADAQRMKAGGRD